MAVFSAKPLGLLEAQSEERELGITFLRVWEKELLSAAFLVVSEGKSFGPTKLQLRTEPAD
jgi:hypothetical protein